VVIQLSCDLFGDLGQPVALTLKVAGVVLAVQGVAGAPWAAGKHPLRLANNRKRGELVTFKTFKTDFWG
jgi:hypothetical protein